MCNFRVGQKVVCVDDAPRDVIALVPVVKGKVYIITGFDPAGGLIVDGAKGRFHYEGYGFLADRFRPVVERKTDISIFRAMLNTTPETVGAA